MNIIKYIPKYKFLEKTNIQRIQRKISCAIVGRGDIGLINAKAIKLSNNCKLHGVYDINSSLSFATLKELNCLQFDSIDKVIEDASLELIIICLPHHLHLEFSKILEKNKNLIIEKPVAQNLSDSKEIELIASESSSKVGVCFPLKFKSTARKSKKILSNKSIGEVKFINIEVNLNKNEEYWRGGFSGRNISDWRVKKINLEVE